jgi:hypothetical protein
MSKINFQKELEEKNNKEVEKEMKEEEKKEREHKECMEGDISKYMKCSKKSDKNIRNHFKKVIQKCKKSKNYYKKNCENKIKNKKLKNLFNTYFNSKGYNKIKNCLSIKDYESSLNKGCFSIEQAQEHHNRLKDIYEKEISKIKKICLESDNYNTWASAGCAEREEYSKYILDAVKRNFNKCMNSVNMAEFKSSNCLKNKSISGIIDLLNRTLENPDDGGKEIVKKNLKLLDNYQKKLKKSSDGLETKKVDGCLKADKKKFIKNGCYNLVDNKFIIKKNRSKINEKMGELCLNNCKHLKKLRCDRIINIKIKKAIDYQCGVTENFKISSSIDINLNILIISIIIVVCGIFFFYKR